MKKADEKFMLRCLQIAECGISGAHPNPMVGAIIVHDGKIIGEGYHQKCGEAHAEVNAINSVNDKELLKKSTIYVSLEPCSHFGRTPPCADLIIKHKIPRVVIACTDTFSEVAGRGIKRLRDSGCSVTVGILEDEARSLNHRFFTYHEKNRPYIILKWAQTIDGFIDIRRTAETPRQPHWITDCWGRRIVHKWRTEEQAILVGTKTAQKDNPKLNVRNWSGKTPLRLVIDQNLMLSSDLSLFDGSIPTVVFTEKEHKNKPNLEFCLLDFERNIPKQILAFLYARKILSIIIEGGTTLFNSFIEQNLWDEARVFVGHKFFNDGTKAPKLNSQPTATQNIGNSKLFWFHRQSL